MKRYIASAYTNRGGCVRRKRLDECGHKHTSYEAASKCARKMQKTETKPRWWSVDTIVWVPVLRRTT